MKRSIFIAITSLSMVACGNPSEVMGGKFNSMQHCLSSIKSKTALTLKTVTDKPDDVSGYLGDTNRHFACTKKSTGTEGTYWEGWYEDK